MCACSVAQSCLTVCDPIDCSPSGSSVHGIFQARILDWVAISSSRGSSWPRDQTWVSGVSYVGRQVLYHWATKEEINFLLFTSLIFWAFAYSQSNLILIQWVGLLAAYQMRKLRLKETRTERGNRGRFKLQSCLKAGALNHQAVMSFPNWVGKSTAWVPHQL